MKIGVMVHFRDMDTIEQNIKISIANDVHPLQSVVAKPVVVISDAVWKNALLNDPPRVG